MDGGGPWRTRKWAGASEEKTIVNRVMLRFRPIAPKPATGDSASGEPAVGNKNALIGSKRVKRKYVRVSKNNRKSTGKKTKRRILDRETADGSNEAVMTLQLMPEKADLDKSGAVDGSWRDLDRTVGAKSFDQENPDPQMRLNLKKPVTDDLAAGGVSDQIAAVVQRRVVESWVTVDSVTGTCMDGVGLGGTDVERMENLGRDTCPGFISDGLNRVMWVNEAYRRMVRVSAGVWEEAQPPETVVRLVVKEGSCPSPYTCGAFSCRARLQYAWQKESRWKMVPCDVWRMDFGGFAWRLDIRAALSLWF